MKIRIIANRLFGLPMRRLAIIFICLFFSIALSPRAEAEDVTLEDAVSDLESSIAQLLPKEISDDELDLSGKKYTVGFFLDRIYSAAKSSLLSSTGYIASLLSLISVSALFHLLETGTGSASIANVFKLIEAAGATLIVYGGEVRMLSLTSGFIKSLSSFMNTMLPLMEAVYIIGGNVSAAAVSTTGIMLGVSVIEQLSSAVFTPLVNICTAFTIAGTIDEDGRLLPFLSSIRKLFLTLLTFCMSILSFSMSLQTVLAANADTIASRSVKFAVGSFIPIVGGAITDTYNTISASGAVLRESAGGAAVTIMVLLLLPPLAALLLNKLTLEACAALARLIGADTVGKVLREASGICTMLIALTVSSTLVFLIGIFVFSKTRTAV